MANIANVLRARNISEMRRLAASASSLALIGAMAAPLLLGAGQAHAAAADPAKKDKDNNTVSEVVVTAEYRSQNVQNTPISITAVNAAMLEERGITNIVDVASAVPNLSMRMGGSGSGASNQAFIRGIGQGDFLFAYSPRIAFYVDDVYFSTVYGSTFDLLDINSIEVDRGPQGVLSGRNAAGGAIKIYSKQPTGDGSGYIEAGYGSYNRFVYRGGWDVTLVPDKVFARFAISGKHADGYMKLLDYVCVHGAGSLGNIKSAVGATSQDGCVEDHLGSEGVDSGRAAVRWLASDRLEVNVIADYTRQRQEAPTDKYSFIADPITMPGFQSLWIGVPQALYGPGVLYDERFVTSSPYTSYARYGVMATDGRNVPNENNLDHWGVSGTIDWDVAPGALHVKNVAAYRSWWNTFGRGDASPLGNSGTFDDTTHHQFTDELQATGKVGNLDYAGGFFYYHAFDQNTGFDALLPPGPPPNGFYDHDLDDHQTTDDWAVFIHGDYHITPQLTLSAGVRYTDDKKDAVVSVTNLPPGPGDFVTPVNVAATRWNPMAELAYQFTPDVMGYALYSTGFRGGGFSPRPSDAVQAVPFGPEDVTNYELGFKSEWFQHRLRLNADVFYMQDDGQQNFKGDIDSLGNTWFHEINAGNSINEGVEVEVAVRPVDGMQIDSSLGYLHYRLKSNEAQRTVLLCTTFSDGTPCPQTRAPTWTFSAGAQYRFNLGSAGSLTPRLDASVISRVYFETFNDTCSVVVPAGTACPAASVVAPPPPSTFISTDPSGVAGRLGYQPGYMLLNGHLTWRSPDNKWSTTFEVMNMTNKAYFYGKLALGALLGREQGNIAPPRTWLLTVRRDF